MSAVSEEECLKIMVNDYDDVYKVANDILAKRAKFFNWSLYLFAIGIIILLVIKFF